MTAKKKIIIGIIASLLLALVSWTIWGNTALELNCYTVTGEELPEAFDGFRIAHVSDLHNTELGQNNEKLIAMLRDARPDIIVITGDLIDSRNTDIAVALEFAEQAMQIAPCYYVTGNHEARISSYPKLKEGLTDLGVFVLEDARLEITRSGESIVLMGVDDPSFEEDYLFGDAETLMENKLTELMDEEDGYTILLSHRPELFEIYADSGVNLILSGHAHGGQFRLPFVGGLVAPNQGLFPEYDAGQYTRENTCMIVSRGVGNSIIPFRFNNRPEVILIELKTAQ